MSQNCVERVIGLLVTDEGFRHRFAKNRRAALLELIERGMVLTEGEIGSLSSLDPRRLSRFARTIDTRLQKTDLRGESS